MWCARCYKARRSWIPLFIPSVQPFVGILALSLRTLSGSLVLCPELLFQLMKSEDYYAEMLSSSTSAPLSCPYFFFGFVFSS